MTRDSSMHSLETDLIPSKADVGLSSNGLASESPANQDDEGDFDLFKEPEDFRPKTPPPSFTTYERVPEDVQEGR